MDTLTHSLLGVGMANAGLKQRFGPGTLMTMLVASNLPDIDSLISFFGGPYAFLSRRMLTHSVFGIPLLALAAAALLRLLYRQISLKDLFGLCLLAMGVHVFFDLVNSYGVVLLYPLSIKRFELALIFIIDFVLWGLLLAPLLLCWIRAPWAGLKWLSRLSLAGIVIYVGFCAAGRFQSSRILARIASDQPDKTEFSYVFPEALGSHRWRGVIRQGNTYRIYLLRPFTGESEFKQEYKTEVGRAEVKEVRKTDIARRLEWFFKAPVWRVISEPATMVTMFDLRFRSVVLDWRDSPFAFRFKISETMENGEKVPPEKK